MRANTRRPQALLGAAAILGTVVLACLPTAIPTWGAAPSGRGEDEYVPKAAALDRLNTPADEDHPCLAPGGLALHYSAKQANGYALMVATRKQRNQPFASGQAVEELAGRGDVACPFPLQRERDGSEYLYLAKRAADGDNFDLYFTRRLKPDQPYQTLGLAPVHQVCTEANEKDPWLSPDLKELYFSRQTPEGWRVGWARGNDPRAFDKVTLLDLPAGFHHPTLTRDALTMYLQGPLVDGRQGIFVSKRPSKSAPWGPPRPIRGLANEGGPRGDVSPSFAPDGSGLFFASDRAGGQGGLDLYFVSATELRKAGV